MGLLFGGSSGSGDGEGAGVTGGGGTREGSGAGGGKRTPGSPGGRPFISYVAVHRDHVEADPDGLDHAARMELEKRAIQAILLTDSRLRRTPTTNTGFDLFEAGADGQPVRWIEVKAMTGGLSNRPVGLSDSQFDCACEHGEAYWIYVVEHAGSTEMNLARIQDPAGQARTFTFDRGWLEIAEQDVIQEAPED